MRFSLQTKSVSVADGPGAAAPNPAAMLRTSNVPMDDGRGWSGDVYTEGAVTDPGSAFASFSDDATDTEAWLDMSDDGTLIGWVRQGDDIYRYLDTEAWSMDVDGAGIQRTDGGGTPEGAVVDPEVADELAAPTDEAIVPGEEEYDPVLEAAAATDEPNLEAEAEEATTADAEHTIGEAAPTAFEEEDDDAVQDEDPTDELEDPTDLPEDEGDGGEEADESFSDLIGDGVSPDDEAEEDETMTVAPDDLPTIDGDEEAEPDPDDPLEDDEEETEEERKKRLANQFQKKHMPGEHNQDTHGNRVSIGGRSPRGRAGAASAVTGPAKQEKPKTSLAESTIKNMTDSELEGITESGDKFDMDTLLSAAAELDERNPIGDTVRDALSDAKPGSMAEYNALANIIPRAWIDWAGRDETQRSRKPTKKDTADDEWLSFMETQKLAAGAIAVGAGLIPAKLNKAFMEKYGSTDALFDGRIPHEARKKWLTTEAKDWFDHNFVSKSEFLDGRSTSSKRPHKAVRSSLNEN